MAYGSMQGQAVWLRCKAARRQLRLPITHCVEAALHHGGHGHQAGHAAGHEALQDLDVALVRLAVPLVWVCLLANVVAHLPEDGETGAHKHIRDSKLWLLLNNSSLCSRSKQAHLLLVFTRLISCSFLSVNTTALILYVGNIL